MGWFAALVFALSVPLWIAAQRVDTATFLPVQLPLSALNVLVVPLAAIVATRRQRNSVRSLLRRGVDVARLPKGGWRVGVFLVMPLVVLASYILSIVCGRSIDARWTPAFVAPVLLGAYFISAYCEQLGWTAIMTDTLLKRWSVLESGLLTGLTWAAWHLIPFYQTHHAWRFIAWQCAFTVAFRVCLTVIYVRTNRSVFATVALHATYNTALSLLPFYGSTYDPLTMTIATVVLGAMLAMLANHTLHRVTLGIGVGLGVLALAVAVALPIVLPVFRFPKPNGPFAIGTVTYHWVDSSRTELLSADTAARRELIVQVWYPAKDVASSPRAPYVQDATLLAVELANMKDAPKFLFTQLQYVTTNAVTLAPVADRSPNFPVLVFLEGAFGFRQMNTFQVEALVSGGYIVVAIDQPYTAASVAFPNGHQARGLPLSRMMPLIRQSYSPRNAAPAVNGRTFRNGIVPYLAQDVGFTLDQLTALNRSESDQLLRGRIDMQHVGAFGMSLGGIVASEACRIDPRIRACLIMDAPMPTDVVTFGLTQPTMWITRDAETMRLERRRSGGWSEADIREHQSTMRATFDKARAAAYFVQVSGLFHVNLTDVPYWSPLLRRFGVIGPIDGQRAHDIVNAYSSAFFDRHLKRRPQTLLDRLSTPLPDVHIETRAPPH